MFLSKDRIGGLILLAFCLGYAWLIQEIPLTVIQAKSAFTARTMPEALSVLGVLLSLALVIAPGSREAPQTRGYAWAKCALFLGLMSLYGLALRPVGFIGSTTLFLMIGFAILGERRPLTLILASLPVVLFFWFLMSEVLDVYVAPWPDFLMREAAS